MLNHEPILYEQRRIWTSFGMGYDYMYMTRVKTNACTQVLWNLMSSRAYSESPDLRQCLGKIKNV